MFDNLNNESLCKLIKLAINEYIKRKIYKVPIQKDLLQTIINRL